MNDPRTGTWKLNWFAPWFVACCKRQFRILAGILSFERLIRETVKYRRKIADR